MSKIALLSILVIYMQSIFATEVMPLNEYLDLVQKENSSYQSKEHQIIGSKLLANEADLIYTPQLFADARSGFDEKNLTPTMFTYDRSKVKNYSVGISKQFWIGLETKISYMLNDVDYKGYNASNAAYSGLDHNLDRSAQIEVSMPLWKNGFGRGVRATEELLRNQALVNQYSAETQAIVMMNEAENSYWRLVAAIEQIKIEEQSVKAAQNILNYVQSQYKKNLGEEADVLQATAVVDSYNLQLQLAQNELRAAKRNFNLLLNRQTSSPVPTLDQFNFAKLEKAPTPKTRPGDRIDIKVNEAQADLAKASSTLTEEKYKPSLDIYSSYTTNGLDKNRSHTKDAAYVGLRFSIPLDIFSQAEAREGAQQSSIAAEKNLQYLKYSQEQHWIDLTQKIADAKQLLKMSGTIENAHKSKLENERGRLRQGRTTTYQVLLFEQDYNQAKAARIRAALQIINLKSQAKLYQNNSKR